jgi:hypothetical protein
MIGGSDEMVGGLHRELSGHFLSFLGISADFCVDCSVVLWSVRPCFVSTCFVNLVVVSVA